MHYFTWLASRVSREAWRERERIERKGGEREREREEEGGREREGEKIEREREREDEVGGSHLGSGALDVGGIRSSRRRPASAASRCPTLHRN